MIEKVVSYERRANNSTEKTVAHLACGHERVFEYGYYPATALCWVCPEKQCEYFISVGESGGEECGATAVGINPKLEIPCCKKHVEAE